MKFGKEKAIRILKNRWFWSVLAFLIIAFFGTHSIIKLSHHRSELSDLRDKKWRLEESIRQDSINTIKMQKDIDYIEKVARERYMMKRENEDIYIFKEEK
jgi:cell division protein FtsB